MGQTQPCSQRQANKQTDRQTDRQTNRQRHRQTERQTNRQTDRETRFLLPSPLSRWLACLSGVRSPLQVPIASILLLLGRCAAGLVVCLKFLRQCKFQSPLFCCFSERWAADL